MAELKDLFQSADWKKEKHVPAIDSPDKSGAILVCSYCNIHGLWQGSKRLEVL
jgi:desulfoferrodoxin (superoxide reductase-like protein)